MRAGPYKSGGWRYRSPAALPLDGKTTGGWAALSLNKLITAYAGSCIQVRRSSDNTTSNIGFSGSGVDTVALLAFCAGSDGFVSFMYDQFGLGNDFSQGTFASQPKIVAAGVYLGKVVFDGIDDQLVSVNQSAHPAGTPTLSLFLRGLDRAPSTLQIYAELSQSYNTQIGAALYTNASQPAMGAGDIISFVADDYITALNNNVMAARYDRTVPGAATTTILNMWVAGAHLTAANLYGGGITLSFFAPENWHLGSRASSLPASIDVTTFVIYEAALVDADMAAYSTALS